MHEILDADWITFNPEISQELTGLNMATFLCKFYTGIIKIWVEI